VTYVGHKSYQVLGPTRGAIKIEVAPKGIEMDIVQNITDRVDGAPDNERNTHPSMQRQDVGVGEPKSLQHRSSQDQEKE
jgi:hypothetical protein